MRTWYPMSSAPKTRSIRLKLQDRFGSKHTFAFAPAKWCAEKNCWVHATKGTVIMPKAAGWQEIAKQPDFGSSKNIKAIVEG